MRKLFKEIYLIKFQFRIKIENVQLIIRNEIIIIL